MGKFLTGFVENFSRGERIYAVVSLLAAIASCVLLFFVPTITVLQVFMVVLTSVPLLLIFGFMFFTSDDYLFEAFTQVSIFVWAMFVSAIMWLFPISLYWSVLPILIATFITICYDEGEIRFVHIFSLALFFTIIYGMAQDNIDKKNILKSDVQPNVVVISKIDLGRNVFFIEHFDEAFSFDFKSLKKAYDMNIESGDTVKIVRHPNSPTKVIRVTK